MKSQKPVKQLKEIVLPFLLKPTTYISGGINGNMFYYSSGFQYELTPEIYETLWNGGYAHELEKSAE